jgi:3-oxoacyl-[acyl-carrier-protein] synthase-3
VNARQGIWEGASAFAGAFGTCLQGSAQRRPAEVRASRAVRIAGAGKCLPDRIVRSAELEQRLGLDAGWIESRTGVRERRFVMDETASELGAEAARRALVNAGASLRDVDLIICAAGSSEQSIPCTAVLVQKQLGAQVEGVPCFDLNSTCISFLNGLDVAANMLVSGAYRGILVVSPEIASSSLNWKEEESCVLLGDGAAAVFLTTPGAGESSEMSRARFTTLSQGSELAQLKGGGTRFHPNGPGTTPDMNLFQMQGSRIFKFTKRQMQPFMQRYLEDLGEAPASFRALVAHQASLFALRSTAKACGFEDAQVLENIQDHGNCVAASIPMVLHDGVSSGRIRRGDRVLLAGTAAGITLGALALTF